MRRWHLHKPSDTLNHSGCLKLPAKAERIARVERQLAVFPKAQDHSPEQRMLHLQANRASGDFPAQCFA